MAPKQITAVIEELSHPNGDTEAVVRQSSKADKRSDMSEIGGQAIKY